MRARNFFMYAAVFLLWLAYVIFTFLSPYPSVYQQMGLSAVGDDIVQLFIAFTRLAGYFVGCYAMLTLRDSARQMTDRDRKIAYERIAMGIVVTVFVYAIAYLIAAIRSVLANDQSTSIALTIVSNLIFSFGPLAGFAYFFSGSLYLHHGETTTKSMRDWVAVGVISFVLFAGVYGWLTLTNTAREISLSGDLRSTYYMSDPLILMAIIIPAIACGILGLMTALQFVRRRASSGQVVLDASNAITSGILFLLTAKVIQDSITAIGPVRRETLGLGPILINVLLYVVVRTSAYFFFAAGARKFAAIERVMQKYTTPV